MSNSYSDEFRAQAYLALKSAGYPKRGSLSKVSGLLNVPKHTLRRWAANLPPPRRRRVQSDLQMVMLAEVDRIINQLPDKRNQASYRELTATLTALVNSVRGFDSLPPELLECGPLLQDIVTRAKEIGWGVRKLFEEIEEEIAQEQARRAAAAKLNVKLPPLPVGDHQ
jgi:transposase-like protein